MDILLANGARGVDLHVSAGDLLLDDSLLTAVVVSLFSDRQAEPGDELPARETDRRGWWADATLPDGDRIGSRLWLLAREKQLGSVLARAQEYAEEALAWLVRDGRAASVSVAASNPARGLLFLDVRVSLPDGAAATWGIRYDTTSETYSLEAA